MSLSEGDIVYVSVDPSWDNPPHPKIVVLVSGGQLLCVKATTDKYRVETKCARFERPAHGVPLRTMVEIIADSTNQLSAASYVDCTVIFPISDQSTPSGKIDAKTMRDIRLGIICSPNHPMSIKNLFITPPNPSPTP